MCLGAARFKYPLIKHINKNTTAAGHVPGRTAHTMLLPTVWQNNKRKNMPNQGNLDVKRQRVQDHPEREERVVDEILCIVRHNLATVSTGAASPAALLTIDTNSILNDIPFERLLGSIATRNAVPDVPIITHVYEERFMRESLGADEKDCIMRDNCEGMFIDSAHAFVCTQFVIPNVSNEHQGMCVMCLRKTTQLLYYKTIYNGHNVHALIQKYGNICNQADEYHPSVMLICPPNGPVNTMPVPIVSHQRNRYSVEVIAGVKHVRQHRVSMQDFR